MLNIAVIMGRLTAAPELRTTPTFLWRLTAPIPPAAEGSARRISSMWWPGGVLRSLSANISRRAR